MKQRYVLMRYGEYVTTIELILGPLEDLGFKPLHYLQLIVLYWSELITFDKAVTLLMDYYIDSIFEDTGDVDLSELEDSLHITLYQVEKVLSKECHSLLRSSKWQLLGLFQNDALIYEVNDNDISPISDDFLQKGPSPHF